MGISREKPTLFFTSKFKFFLFEATTPDQHVKFGRSEVSPAARMHSPPKINAGRVTTLSQNTAKPEPQCVQSYPITSLLPTIVSTKFIPQNKKSWPWHNLLPEFPSRSDIDSRAYIKLDKDPSNNHQDPNDPNNDPNSRYKHNEDMMRNGNHNGAHYHQRAEPNRAVSNTGTQYQYSSNGREKSRSISSSSQQQ